MATKTIQHVTFGRSRERAAKRLDEWRKRNAKRLQGWNAVNTLRVWRGKRWSS